MKTRNNEQGFMIGSLLVLILVISILLLTITSAAIGNFQNASKANARINAQFAADSGLDRGLFELNSDDTWPGTGYIWDGAAWVGSIDEEDFFDNGDVRTTYEVEIFPGSTADRLIVRSTGRTYSPSTSTTPEATRIFELEAEAVTSGTGPGSVVSGVGGLILENNAKITGGDVIVNGNLEVSNNAQIGLSTTSFVSPNNAVNLRVAHQNCPDPPDATYPQVCVFGEPIINNGVIYADVRAENQTTSTGMSNPGLVSSTSAPVAVPGYDRTAHKAASSPAGGYSPNSAPIKCSGNAATWPADAKISGDVSVPNNCEITILGNVWITGDLSFGNNVDVIVDDTLMSTRPVIMIDGEDGLDTGNNSQFISNTTGTGAEVITTWWNTDLGTNGGFDCGGIYPDLLDCPNVTGLALSTSQVQTTIDLSNNTNADDTVFRTLWTRAEISNNGALGAVAGQTILLKQNAVINFTASIPGSDNLTTTWVKRGYLRVFQ